MRSILNINGYGLSVISKLKETPVKRNLYYEIKDKVLEEIVDASKGRIIRKTRKTKVYGLHTTREIRDTLIELLTERVRHHKDKFISPTLYQELRGLEVKKSGKVEHSDLTHDDNLFSYLMALYVWYEGKNLRESFGIEKVGIKTEESVDDIVELEATDQLGDITEQIAFANKIDNDKFEAELMRLQKAKGVMFYEYMDKQRKSEQEHLELMLQNPVIKQVYANHYQSNPDNINVNNQFMGNNTVRIPDSMFLDFNKDSSELDQTSIYNGLYDDIDRSNIEDKMYDESLQ